MYKYPFHSYILTIKFQKNKWKKWFLLQLQQQTYFGIQGETLKMESNYKNCVCILTCLNFSQCPSTLPLIQYTYWLFFTAQNNFWTHWFVMPFSASAIFSFSSSTSAKRFPLRTFFIQGEKKSLKVRLGNKEGWAQELCHFWSKTTAHPE